MAAEMIELERSSGAVAKVRKDQVEKVLRVINEQPGLTARDISMQSHVTTDNINLILECHPDGQDLVKAGKVARPTRGQMPKWASVVDPSLIPEPVGANALVKAHTAFSALPESIKHQIAREDAAATVDEIAQLMRKMGGSSPTRLKQVNSIVQNRIASMAYHLQKADEATIELKEALQEIADENKELHSEADRKDQMLNNLQRHMAVLEERAEGYKLMYALLKEGHENPNG